MKILVTGGAGYLGTLLVRKLLNTNHEVMVVDIGTYGYGGLEGLPIQLVKRDIRSVNNLENVDAVIHLASIVGDAACDLDMKETINVNLKATDNLAKLCKKFNKKLIYASTCSVYGENPGKMSTENDETVIPISLYGQTKLKSEKLIKDSDCDYIIMRLGTLYGLSHRMRFDLVINLFAAKAVMGERLTVFGGEQWRPFCHVNDASSAFVQALNWKSGSIFNVANGNFKIIDIAKEISGITNCGYEVSKEVEDRRDYNASIKKVMEYGWKPQKTVRDAVVEIQTAYNLGFWKDYKNPIYSNYKLLFQNIEMMKKLYTEGSIVG
jgi:nucleoside-diphosphate-sugar epimerase